MSGTKRINRAIELLQSGQPIYYTGINEISFACGEKNANTWADYICVDLEHHPFEPSRLHDFMLGLIAAGPTPTGHRTPAVIVTLPIDGIDESSVRYNSWMIKQALAAGVHGLMLCHVESPDAVKAFVETARYAHQQLGVDTLLNQGRRGAGGQFRAASVWDITVDEYLDRADVWPLNPNGELLLGVKLENTRALKNADASVAVPGIGFAEWGPGDMGMCFGHKEAHDPPYPPEMVEARNIVKAACDKADVAFLDIVTPDNITAQIDDGVKVGAAQSEETARIGRDYIKRLK